MWKLDFIFLVKIIFLIILLYLIKCDCDEQNVQVAIKLFIETNIHA